MLAAIGGDNALLGPLTFVTDLGAASNLMADLLDAGSGRFIWEAAQIQRPNMLEGRIGAIRALASSQITSGDFFLGSFDQVLIGQWGGLDVILDPYTNSTRGRVRIVALQSIDIALRHGQAFCFNNDT